MNIKQMSHRCFHMVGSGDNCFVRTWNGKRAPGTEKVRGQCKIE
ncbi:hypothetical protein GYH30_024010 [Glycine max]|nr:hypothetical protein GYH30_024010 [Glycine max]